MTFALCNTSFHRHKPTGAEYQLREVIDFNCHQIGDSNYWRRCDQLGLRLRLLSEGNSSGDVEQGSEDVRRGMNVLLHWYDQRTITSEYPPSTKRFSSGSKLKQTVMMSNNKLSKLIMQLSVVRMIY